MRERERKRKKGREREKDEYLTVLDKFSSNKQTNDYTFAFLELETEPFQKITISTGHFNFTVKKIMFESFCVHRKVSSTYLHCCGTRGERFFGAINLRFGMQNIYC